MSCAWKYPNCKIGVILGTGTNACYIEKAINAELFDKPNLEEDEKVLINTEWGAFGDYGSLEFLRSRYDHEIDQNSINPASQLFEKMVSGMYLGELVRLVLVRLTKDGIIFNGKLSQELNTRNLFLTKYVSKIEEESKTSVEEAREVLMKVGYENASDEDCVNARYVCECMSRRAAHLVSAALATIILKMEYKDIVIGIDGSLFRYHPTFKDVMAAKVKELIPENYKFEFVLSEDGSGCGAALVAAVATRQEMIRSKSWEEYKLNVQ